MKNVHDITMEATKNFRFPVTASVIQGETSPRLSLPTLLSCLNDLVRRGELKEGQNEVGKRTFEAKER